MKVAVLSSKSVALTFSRFVFFEIESSCFLKRFSKSLNRNTWHFVQYLWRVGLFNNFLQRNRKVLLLLPIRSHWNWIWARCRINPQTDAWSERHSACQKSFSLNFFQWVENGREDQLGNKNLECALQRNSSRKLHVFHSDLQEWTKIFLSNVNRMWTLLLAWKQPLSPQICLLNWLSINKRLIYKHKT